MMWSNHFLLGLVGLTAGVAVSAGTFAFLITIGVIPRIIGKSKTAVEVLWYETAVCAGGICGNIFSVFTDLPLRLGHPLLVIYGLCAGIYVGCMAAALAEIMNTFPIMFRRIHLKRGLAWVIFFMAMGKVAGSLLFFLKDFAID